jgi:Leucine-rich repeat (LRR) protein
MTAFTAGFHPQTLKLTECYMFLHRQTLSYQSSLQFVQFRFVLRSVCSITIKQNMMFLKLLPLLLFIPLTQADLEIDCRIEKVDTKYSCKFILKYIKKDDVISIMAYHDTSYDRDIKLVTFDSSSVHAIPKTIFRQFRNLEELEVQGQSVQEITSKTFLMAEKLKLLDLSNNDLTLLASEAFKGADNLEKLYLDFNRIKEVHKESLRNLRSLKELNLGNNQIDSLHHNTFRYLVNLKVLNLEQNQLDFIPDILFLKNLNLNVIDLSGNKLSFISNVMFSLLSNLDKLWLQGNLCVDKNYSEANFYIEIIEMELRNCSIGGFKI